MKKDKKLETIYYRMDWDIPIKVEPFNPNIHPAYAKTKCEDASGMECFITRWDLKENEPWVVSGNNTNRISKEEFEEMVLNWKKYWEIKDLEKKENTTKEDQKEIEKLKKEREDVNKRLNKIRAKALKESLGFDLFPEHSEG